VICEKKITNYINRTEYPLGLGQKFWPQRILFDKSCLQRILFHQNFGLWRIFFTIFLLKPERI